MTDIQFPLAGLTEAQNDLVETGNFTDEEKTQITDAAPQQRQSILSRIIEAKRRANLKEWENSESAQEEISQRQQGYMTVLAGLATEHKIEALTKISEALVEKIINDEPITQLDASNFIKKCERIFALKGIAIPAPPQRETTGTNTANNSGTSSLTVEQMAEMLKQEKANANSDGF